MNFTTLDSALAARLTSNRAIHYIEGEGNERTLPFSALYSRAAGLLHHFQSCGARPGSERFQQGICIPTGEKNTRQLVERRRGFHWPRLG